MQKEAFGIIPVYKKKDSIIFLLVQHNEDNPKHWGFPKGHAKGAESKKETAIRELKEETGIWGVDVLDDVPLIENYTFVRNGVTISKVVTYFIGFVKSRKVTIQAEEIADYMWGSYEETRGLITFQEGREILRQAQEYLNNKID